MLLYRITDWLCDLTTNVSKEAVERFVFLNASPAAKITHVYNGIDTDKFVFDQIARERIRESNSIKGPLILAVGRLTEAKDYPNLLNALVLVLEELPDVKLWIVGDGHLKENLLTESVTLNVSNHVTFLGVRNDVYKIMSAADVFVLSSAWEGFPLVVAEALACQRPVVATDCGGVRESISENGQLVEPKSHVALAKAIIFCLQNNVTLNKSGRQRVEDYFSFNKIIPIWETLYVKS